MNDSKKRVVILGAGVAGLSAAWKLLRENPNLQVTLVERDSLPGGLAKSVNWNGYVLDLGPHRFHTEIPEIKSFIKTFCEERMITVKRASRMYLNGRYIPYPIKALPTFQALGPVNTISMALSALAVFLGDKSNAQTYEDYVIGYYGEKLYRRIFKPFAEKVWGIPAERITAETARVRLRGETIWHSLLDGLFSKQETYVAQFLYPPGGIGDIPQQFAQEALRMGADIHINHTVTKVRLENGRIVRIEASGPKGTVEIPCDLLINTLPLPTLTRLIEPSVPDAVSGAASALRFRAVTLLYLQYNEDLGIDDTWLYFPEENIPFSRIYVPDNFAPHKKQPGKTCLCVEFPCEVSSEYWHLDKSFLANLADDVLSSTGLTHSRSVDALVLRIEDGYPLYELGYEKNVKSILDCLKSMDNCLSTGRQGLFRHNNLDQSLQMGLLAAEYILQNDRCEGWYDGVHRFNDYRIVD